MTTGLDVLDKSAWTTNIWLDEIMAEIGPDRRMAWHVRGVVLRCLRDRISVGLGNSSRRAVAARYSRRLLRPIHPARRTVENSQPG
jgi:hypothetical protein